jgi:hypothetical protein
MRLNNIAEIKCFLENVLINNKRRSMDFEQQMKKIKEEREAKETALRLKGILKVEIVRSGQVKAYQDSIYEYIITATCPEEEVKNICLTEIYPCNPEYKGSNFSGHCSFPFGLNNFYSFSKKSENQYRYIVCSPYCD